MATFSDRINEALQMRKTTPAELHRLTKIPESQISAYRKGLYKAGQRNTEKIAIALNVPIPWLMGLVDEVSVAVISKDVYTEEELELLESFRRLNDTGKSAVLNILKAYINMPEFAKKEESAVGFI